MTVKDTFKNSLVERIERETGKSCDTKVFVFHLVELLVIKELIYMLPSSSFLIIFVYGCHANSSMENYNLFDINDF